MDLGVTYIPWEKVKLDDLDGFAEGGIIDQETVNDGIRNTPQALFFDTTPLLAFTFNQSHYFQPQPTK